MTDIEEFMLSSYNSVKELCCTTINKVSLVKLPWEEKFYIKRVIYGNKYPVYSLLKKLDINGVPGIKEVIYDGNTYVIEEYIDGKLLSLAELKEDELFNVLNSLLGILQKLHQHDIIHCDIKAENIMLTPENKPFLLDFAIARIDNHDNVISTTTVGTVENAAPEQFGTGHIDLRSDLFSFGKMCYTLLSSLPYSNSAQRKLWEEISARCINFYPKDRFQSAGEILDILAYPGMVYGPSKKRIVDFKNTIQIKSPPSYAPCIQIQKKLGKDNYTLEIIFLRNSILCCIQATDNVNLSIAGTALAWHIYLEENGTVICSHIEYSLCGFKILNGEVLLNYWTLEGFPLDIPE